MTALADFGIMKVAMFSKIAICHLPITDPPAQPCRGIFYYEIRREKGMKDFIHVLFAGVIGALAAYFNVLLVPLAVLVAVMLIDYVTGMAGAAYTKTLSSRTGVLGIVKKAAYLALVAVGMVVDYLITSALVHIGIHLQINYCFGMIITIWLIINELISILENLGELNIPLPRFLVDVVKSMKDKVESKADGKHYRDGEE